jgi:hypothetical protein
MAAEERVDLLRGAKRRLETKTRPQAAPERRRRFRKQEAGSGRHEKALSMKDSWQIDSHRIVAGKSWQAMRAGRPSRYDKQK